MKSVTPVTTQMIKKKKKVKESYCWSGESFNDLDRDQNGHISLSQSQVQSKGPNSLQFYEGREMRKLQKKSEESGGWFMKFKERSHLHDTEVQSETTSEMEKLQQVIQKF